MAVNEFGSGAFFGFHSLEKKEIRIVCPNTCPKVRVPHRNAHFVSIKFTIERHIDGEKCEKKPCLLTGSVQCLHGTFIQFNSVLLDPFVERKQHETLYPFGMHR